MVVYARDDLLNRIDRPVSVTIDAAREHIPCPQIPGPRIGAQKHVIIVNDVVVFVDSFQGPPSESFTKNCIETHQTYLYGTPGPGADRRFSSITRRPSAPQMPPPCLRLVFEDLKGPVRPRQWVLSLFLTYSTPRDSVKQTSHLRSASKHGPAIFSQGQRWRRSNSHVINEPKNFLTSAPH